MRITNVVAIVVSLCAASLVGCGSATEPTLRQLAWIGYQPNQAIVAPDTVRVGQPFDITVTTWGSGSRACNDPDGTTVAYLGSVARVTAFVRVPRGDVTCTRDLRSYPQRAVVRLQSPGVAVIRLIGAKSSHGMPVVVDSVERVVVVVP